MTEEFKYANSWWFNLIAKVILIPFEIIGIYLLWEDDNKIRKAMNVSWKEFKRIQNKNKS
jgi:hypothetical protein